MAKAKNPITLSRHFDINPRRLDALGVLDVTLAIDTHLFLDPLLLPRSRHAEIKVDAATEYRKRFETVISLLASSRARNDAAWKGAERLLTFHEIRGTCLGYGANSIHGSGLGITLSRQLLNVASEIVAIGVHDPDLFSALALIEAGIGPDRISDMATNIVIDALAKFNKRVLAKLDLRGDIYDDHEFLSNPFEQDPTPIILLPTDVLRTLPIAYDWDSIAAAASHNATLRLKVNEHISSIWAIKAKRDKDNLKTQALANTEAFETLLKAIKSVDGKPYDVSADPEGVIQWARRGEELAQQHPIRLALHVAALPDAFDVVKEIVAQFRQLIEHEGLNKDLYHSKKPRHESTAQRLFFAVAHAYCRANNLDISPEIDTGNGKVDFKFSRGFADRVLVEVKLSTNAKVVDGYETQLEVYRKAQRTMRAIYLVIDVGRMGDKDKRLIEMRNESRQRGNPLSELEFVDGTLKPSASKR